MKVKKKKNNDKNENDNENIDKDKDNFEITLNEIKKEFNFNQEIEKYSKEEIKDAFSKNNNNIRETMIDLMLFLEK